MTAARRNNLRSIMKTAWGLYRSDPSRGFADALRGAWSFARRMAKTAAKFMRGVRRGQRVDFSRSIIVSSASNRFGMGSLADRHAGASISRVSR